MNQKRPKAPTTRDETALEVPKHAEYNFGAVKNVEACCFYEWARESAKIREVVVGLRKMRASLAENFQNTSAKLEVEYREVGDSRRAECVFEFCDEVENVLGTQRFPAPNGGDAVRFAWSLLALASILEFPGKPWQEIRNLPQAFVAALEHEAFAVPPGLIMQAAGNATDRLQSFLLNFGEFYRECADHGAPVYGFFRLDLEANEEELRRELDAIVEKMRKARNIKRRGRTVSVAPTRLMQLGALRLRHPRYGQTFSEAVERLGHYAHRADYGRACTSALRYFSEFFALADGERPVSFSSSFRRTRLS